MADLDFSLITADDIDAEEKRQQQQAGPLPAVGGGISGKSDLDFSKVTADDLEKEEKKIIQLHTNVNPADDRKADTAARKLGVPKRVVESDISEALKTITADDLDEKTKDSPRTRAEILDSKVGPAIQDDVDSFINFEKLAQNAQDIPTLRGRELGAAFLRDFGGLTLRGFAALNDVSARGISNALRAINLGPVADALEKPVLPWWANPSGVLREPGRKLTEIGNIIDSTEKTVAADITRGVGQLAGQVTAHIVTGGVASLPTLLAQGAGVMSDKLKDTEVKGPVGEALGEQAAKDTAIVTGAVITGLTEKYGLDRLLNRVPPKIKNGVLRFLTDVAFAGGTEAAQEVVEGILHDMTILAVVNPEAEVFKGLEREAIAAGGAGAIFRGLLNAAVKGRRVMSERQQVRRAEEHRERLLQVLETTDSSTVAAESPELFQEVLDRIVTDTDLETVRVNAGGLHAMFEAADDPVQAIQFLEEAGISREEITEAVRLGLDVPIPINKFINGVKEAEFRELVLMNVRDGIDAPTMAEAQVMQVEAQQETDDIIESIRQGLPEDSYMEAEEIGNAITEQIMATGMYRAEGARKIGDLFTALLQTASEAEGREAIDLFKEMGVNIRRIPFAQRGQPVSDQLLGDPAVLNQEAAQYGVDAEQLRGELQEAGGEITQTRTFKEWFAESVVQEEKPFTENPYPLIPKVVYHSTRVDDIREFRPFTHFGTAEAANDRTNARLNFSGQLAGEERGIPEEDIAAWWRDLPDEERRAMSDEFFERGVSVMPVYLSIQSPLAIDDNDYWGDPRNLARYLMDDGVIEREDYLEVVANPTFDTLATILELAGYDGIMYQNSVEDPGSVSYIAFRPEQVKSVFNQGTFNLADRDILRQSAVPLQRRPMQLKGTGPGGRVTNWDFGVAMTERHMQKYGRALDPADDADYDIIVTEMNKEYVAQQKEHDSGNGWYVEDIAAAIETTKYIIPELEDAANRDLFLTLAALLSPQEKPRQNWEKAIVAMQGFLENGVIPEKKPNGKSFGVNELALPLLQTLIDDFGVAGALEWVQTPKTGREVAEFRKKSGLYHGGNQDKPLSQYKAAEFPIGDEQLGIYMFGPKVGDFMMNATGIDPEAVTVDLWLARTYNRHIGRLLDVAPKLRENKQITSEIRTPVERGYIKKLTRDLAERNGVQASAMQAALWYFEQRLYRNHGIKSDSQNFSGAAVTAAKKREIALPGTGESIERSGDVTPVGLPTEFADDQLFQERKGLGLLYDPLERIIEDLKLDQWKTRKDQTEPPRAKGPAIWEKLQKIEVPAGSDQKDMLKWSGLEEFLTASIPGEPPRKFTRQDVIEFLQGNAFVLDETIAAEEKAEQSLASSETPYEGAGAIELDIDEDDYQILPSDHPENEDRRNRLTEDVKDALLERFTEMDYFELMREEIEGGPYIIEFVNEMERQLDKNTDFATFRTLEQEYMRLTGDERPVLGTPATRGNITGDLFDESIEETANRKLREWERRVSDWIRRDPQTGLLVPQGATTEAATTEEPIDEAVERTLEEPKLWRAMLDVGFDWDPEVEDGAEPNRAGLGLSLADFFDDAMKGVAQQIMDDEPLVSWKGSYRADRPEGTGVEIIGTANDFDGTGYFLNGEYVGRTFKEALKAAQKSVDKKYSDERLVPRWEFYEGKSTVMPGDYENYREIKLILPEILEGQKFSHHYPDDALLGFLRVTDREFIDQAAFKAFQENLESRPDRGFTDKYVAEDLARRPVFWPPELLAEYPGIEERGFALELMLYGEEMQFGEALRKLHDDHHSRMRLESADLQKAALAKRMYGLDEMQSDIHQKSRGVFRIKATEAQRDEATEQLSRQREIIARAVNRMPTSVLRNMLEAFNNSLKITDSQWRSKMEDTFQDPNRTGFGEAVIQFYYSVYRIGNVPWLEYKADKPDVPENATHKAKLWNYVKYWSDKNEDMNAFFEALKEEKKLDDFLERSDPDNKTKYFPDAPFQNTGWHSLMLKRALVDAAERGMEKFAWPNLQAMLERWSGTAEESFSKQYNQSMVKKVKQLTGQKPKEYDFAFNEITEASLEKQAEELVERPQIQIPDGFFGVSQGETAAQIAFDQVGYDEWTQLLDQLRDLHTREEEGVDIITDRSEPSLAYLREFYRNSISPEGPVQRKLNELNEFAHRAGLYPESITIKLASAPTMMNTRLVPSFGYQFVWKKPTRIDEDGNVTDFEMVELGKPAGAAGETYLFREGREALDEFFRTSPLRALRKYVTKKPAGMWIIDLPQELRDEILTGEYFARMQEDDTAAADPLGAFNLATGSIDLFENADFSTLLHESGHVFVTFLERLAQRENASERTKEIYQSMLDWVGAENADDLNIRINGEAAIEKQERLARAFEAYLKEGKAPSAKLQNAFAMFKQWLMRIYNRIRQLDIVIDDEIRQVFDRMLATDREIEEMKQMNAFDLSSPSVMGLMSDEERSNYTRLMNDADEEARAEAARAQAEAAARADQDWWKRSLEKMKTAVEKEMFETNAPYRAFYFLTRGKFRSGPTAPELEGKKLLKQDLLDMGLTQEQLNALPRAASRIYSTSEENTLSPTVMAAALNFSSAEEMIDVLTNMVPVAEAVQRNAEMQMRSEFGDPLNDGTTEQLAEEALYNDKRRRAIEIELDALATATGQQKVGKAVVKAIVDRVFNEVAVGELLTPMKYQAASVRAAKEAERAAAAGDNMLAFEKKRQQLLNHELFRRGLAARDEVEKITKKLRDIQRKKQDGKKIDPDYIAQVNNLLRFYELGNMSLKRFEENTASIASSVMQFIENQRLAGEPIVLPGDLVEVVSFDSNGQPVYSFKTTHWRQMTMAEIKGLRDMVDNLMKVGRNNSEAEKEALKLRAENLGVAIDQNTRPRKVRDKKLLKPRRKKQQKSINIEGWWASHRKLESLLRQLDGFEAMGPAWREIFQDLADAQNSKVKMVRESLDALNRIFKDYSLKERMMNGTQKIDVLGVGITKEQAMTLLLNWGNETSREAVLEDTTMKEMYGDAWNEETINAIFDEVLTEKDLFTVNQIWEHIDSFWPQISALEREDTGVVPPKVDPDPFMVGQTLMRGGYYPLKYDNLNDSRVAVEKQQEINVGVMSGGFARAQTSHGFTIARVGSGGRAVRLDFGVLSEHLEEVTQDLAYRKAVRNADKMFKQPAVREAIVRALGQAHYNEMVGVLTSVAGAHIVDQPVGPVKALQWARMSTTIAIMGWNLKSILTQPFGLTQSMARIGFWNTAAGAVEFWGMPWKSAAKIREIHEKSEYMRDRSRTMTRELEETLNAINPPNIQDTLVKAAFAPMVITDVFGVAGPTWLGAYNSALSGKVENIMAGDEVDAIRYADSVVRTTQGSGGALNLSGIQQQGEAKKLLTMFYGYFNTTYNMMAEATQKARLDGGVKGASHLAAQTMYLIILPAIISGLMLEKWPDEEDTDDDPEKAWLKWALLQVFNYGAGTIVLGRDVARGVTTDFDFQLSPITGFFGNMARFADDAWEIAVDLADDGELEDGEIPDSAIKNAARLFGTLMKIPGTNQIVRSIDTWMKMEEGELKNEPRNELERIQKLLFTGDR